MGDEEQAASVLDNVAVGGLYLLLYSAVFGALVIGAYVMARQIVLGA